MFSTWAKDLLSSFCRSWCHSVNHLVTFYNSQGNWHFKRLLCENWSLKVAIPSDIWYFVTATKLKMCLLTREIWLWLMAILPVGHILLASAQWHFQADVGGVKLVFLHTFSGNTWNRCVSFLLQRLSAILSRSFTEHVTDNPVSYHTSLPRLHNGFYLTGRRTPEHFCIQKCKIKHFLIKWFSCN